jgi:hypothetical protein
MAKNKFNIQINIIVDDEHIAKGKLFKNIELKKLPELNKIIKMSESRRLAIYGDLDVKNIITKKSNFDYSYFPWLVLYGDFRCSKYSRIFPRVVSGCFDCSNLGKDWIDKDIVFPLTYKIDCSYSINDFDDLIGILPDTLEVLVVEPKLIKKSFLKENYKHLKIALDFIEMYKDVQVVDTNGVNIRDVLQEIVDDIDAKNSKQSEKQKQNIEPKYQKKIEHKVKGKHLDRREIFGCVREMQEFASLLDDDLNRLVRIALSDQRNNGVNKLILRRDDGADVTCIDVSQLPLVSADLVKQLQEKITVKQDKENQVVEQVKVENKPGKEKISVKLEPVEIKKYITPLLCKSIRKSSDREKLVSVLSAIDEINLNPLDMQFQGAVHILKDGKKVVSATVKKEAGCCIVQSIDSSTNNDNKRLVWRVADGPNGPIFVCMGFRKGHDKQKSRKQYSDLRNIAQRKEFYSEQDLAMYQEVKDILAALNTDDGGRPNPDVPEFKNDIFAQKMSDMLVKKY